MGADRSLEEFATDEPVEEKPTPEDIDGLDRTYRWCAEAQTCTGCGEETNTFWRVRNRFVCPSCKEW